MKGVRDHVRFGHHDLHVVYALASISGQAQRRRVPLVPVHDKDPVRACGPQAAADVHEDSGQRLREETQRSCPRSVVVRNTARPQRGDHGVEPIGDALTDRQRRKRVRAQWQVAAVLLDAAGDHDRNAAAGDEPSGNGLGQAFELALGVAWHVIQPPYSALWPCSSARR